MGSWKLAAYGFEPGTRGRTPSTWPASSPVGLAADRPTLILFAHARCACTQATLSELMLLMTRCGGLVRAHVLVYRPRTDADAWVDSPTWRGAAAIPGVDVAWDDDGQAAELFGATTSGHVVLYDEAGCLLFSGGITASRGHSGDNAGRTALTRLLEGRGAKQAAVAAAPATTPVFGCAIVARDREGGQR
jgi:hypothetical protein